MGMGGIAGGGAHRMVCSGGGVARPICSAPYGPSAEAKSARLTSWRATAARTVRVCAHLPRAFMHPGLGACVPCGASCSGGPALAYPISGGGASCHRPVPAASRFWARRDARPKGGVLSPAGGRTKQQRKVPRPLSTPRTEGHANEISGRPPRAPLNLHCRSQVTEWLSVASTSPFPVTTSSS